MSIAGTAFVPFSWAVAAAGDAGGTNLFGKEFGKDFSNGSVFANVSSVACPPVLGTANGGVTCNPCLTGTEGASLRLLTTPGDGCEAGGTSLRF